MPRVYTISDLPSLLQVTIPQTVNDYSEQLEKPASQGAVEISVSYLEQGNNEEDLETAKKLREACNITGKVPFAEPSDYDLEFLGAVDDRLTNYRQQVDHFLKQVYKIVVNHCYDPQSDRLDPKKLENLDLPENDKKFLKLILVNQLTLKLAKWLERIHTEGESDELEKLEDELDREAEMIDNDEEFTLLFNTYFDLGFYTKDQTDGFIFRIKGDVLRLLDFISSGFMGWDDFHKILPFLFEIKCAPDKPDKLDKKLDRLLEQKLIPDKERKELLFDALKPLISSNTRHVKEISQILRPNYRAEITQAFEALRKKLKSQIPEAVKFLRKTIDEVVGAGIYQMAQMRYDKSHS